MQLATTYQVERSLVVVLLHEAHFLLLLVEHLEALLLQDPEKEGGVSVCEMLAGVCGGTYTPGHRAGCDGGRALLESMAYLSSAARCSSVRFLRRSVSACSSSAAARSARTLATEKGNGVRVMVETTMGGAPALHRNVRLDTMKLPDCPGLHVSLLFLRPVGVVWPGGYFLCRCGWVHTASTMR